MRSLKRKKTKRKFGNKKVEISSWFVHEEAAQKKQSEKKVEELTNYKSKKEILFLDCIWQIERPYCNIK